MTHEAIIKGREITGARDERLAAVYYIAKTEVEAGRGAEALKVLTEHYPLVVESRDHESAAKCHAALAILYQEAGESDRALIEYAAAGGRYELAGARDVAACVENNTALLLSELGRGDEAREHLRRARSMLSGRAVRLAEVDVTEAQICLAEGKAGEAYLLALTGCGTFAAHGEGELLLKATPTLQKAAADYVVTR